MDEYINVYRYSDGFVSQGELMYERTSREFAWLARSRGVRPLYRIRVRRHSLAEVLRRRALRAVAALRARLINEGPAP